MPAAAGNRVNDSVESEQKMQAVKLKQCLKDELKMLKCLVELRGT